MEQCRSLTRSSMRPSRRFVVIGERPSQVAIGERLYNRHCARCHVFGRGLMPDLRRSPAIASDDALQAIVLKGALRPLCMASFSDVLSAQDAVALRAYLVDAAHAAQTPQ